MLHSLPFLPSFSYSLLLHPLFLEVHTGLSLLPPFSLYILVCMEAFEVHTRCINKVDAGDESRPYNLLRQLSVVLPFNNDRG